MSDYWIKTESLQIDPVWEANAMRAEMIRERTAHEETWSLAARFWWKSTCLSVALGLSVLLNILQAVMR